MIVGLKQNNTNDAQDEYDWVYNMSQTIFEFIFRWFLIQNSRMFL